MKNSQKCKRMYFILLLTLIFVACNAENQDDSQHEVDETQPDLFVMEEIQEDDYDYVDYDDYEELEQTEISNHNIIAARNFSDGLAWVNLRLENDVENWAAIDTEGNIQFFIDNAPGSSFFNGVAMLTYNSIIDRYGNIVISNEDSRFDQITGFDSGYIWVEKRTDTLERSVTEYGILDSSGEWVHELAEDERLRFLNREGGVIFGDFLVTRDISDDVQLLDLHSLDFILQISANYRDLFWLEYNDDSETLLIFHPRDLLSDVSEQRVIFVTKDGFYEEFTSPYIGGVGSDSFHDPIVRNHVIEGGSKITLGSNSFETDLSDDVIFSFYDFIRDETLEIPHTIINSPRFEGEYCFIVMPNEGGVYFATVIDRNGNHLFDAFRVSYSEDKPRFARDTRLSEGLVWLQDEQGDHISINTQGEIVISVQADSVNEFQDGLAMIEVGEFYHFIDAQGEIVFNVRADHVHQFQNGFAVIEVGEYFYYIDRMGDKLIIR